MYTLYKDCLEFYVSPALLNASNHSEFLIFIKLDFTPECRALGILANVCQKSPS